MHDSITVQDETTVTPYLPRDHDKTLRGHLKKLKSRDADSLLVLVVGTSCTGKTRTLFEAVRQLLPKWRLVAPGSDSDLARILLDGVPAHTVVWLDELQDQLTKTSHGVTAANVIRLLLGAAGVGPILFAGTVWPTNHDALPERPDPKQSSDGTGAIRALLETAVVVEVPEAFTDADLAAGSTSNDARLRRAVVTAAEISHPEQGRKITQVLAGGTQLVNRLHPPPENAPRDKFSPGARAVLHAAGDLRRVGLPNPLPRWALEGAAPGYLDSPTTRPAQTWLPAALDETTQDATTDDPITGNRSLDVHAKGVPALTPHWTTSPPGQDVEAYDLHDYLYQDHINQHRASPTRPQLWDTLTSHPHHLVHIQDIANAALNRGLLTTAIELLRNVADTGNRHNQDQLVEILATRGDDTALTELRARGDAGNRLAQARVREILATRGDDTALTELRARADAGNRRAQNRLREILATSGDDTALTELRARANAGNRHARHRLVEIRATRGDDTALTELRNLADTGDRYARHRLVDVLATRGDDTALTELRTRANAGNRHARHRLVEVLATRGDDTALSELRNFVNAGKRHARHRRALDRLVLNRLVEVLATRGDDTALSELRNLVNAGNRQARRSLAQLLRHPRRRHRPDRTTNARRHRRPARPVWARRSSRHPRRRHRPVRAAKPRRRRQPARPVRLAQFLTTRGDDTALSELRNLAYAGNRHAQSGLVELLTTRGDDTALSELRNLAYAGNRHAQDRLFHSYPDAATRPL